MEHRAFDEGDEDDAPGESIVWERPPLREGKVFVDYDERATIAENLEAAYVRLNEAFRGIWVEKALESGHAASTGTMAISTGWSRSPSKLAPRWRTRGGL